MLSSPVLMANGVWVLAGDEVGACAARLASPTIPTLDLLTQFVIHVRCQAKGSTFRSDSVHKAFPVTWCRNVCLSLLGRKTLKNRNADCERTPEFPSSRFAPAKKSAQIISRQ